MNIKQTFLKISAVITLAALVAIGVAGNTAHAEVKCGFDASTGEPVCAEQGGPGGNSGVTIVDEPPEAGGSDAATQIDGEIKYEGDTDCDGVETSIIGNDNLCESAGENGKLLGILIWIIRIMSVGVGVAAVGGVIYAALLYTSAAGGTEQVKKAIQMFINITIGLLVWGLSVAIVNFLVPGGVFR